MDHTPSKPLAPIPPPDPLSERIKELNCLYGISNLFENQDVSLAWIMQRAVALIPAAFQYPENACARIRLDNRAYTSENFIVTPWRQNIPIVLNGSQVGDLDVYYIEEPPHSGDGLFLEEEERLLRVIGERLSKVLWLKRSEEALKESEERYRVLTEQIAEGVALVQNAKFCYVNPAFCRMFAIAGAQTVQDKPLCDLTAELSDDIARIYEIDQGRIVLEKHEKVHHLVRPDRSIWLQVCHSPITFRGEPALLSTFKDISEIKEEQLAAQRRADLLTSENRVLRSSLKERYRLGDIIGRSPGIQHVYELILKAAAADAAVAIFGESGSGKELVAHAIHQNSARCHSSFVAVNCGAIQESLFEREFFGHRKGAFSSAHADAPGYLDLANGGTLFLDEVGELSLSMQAKLLRAIEGGGYRPIGATETLSADFRIISASNTALSEKVTSGQLRSDFFYRIQVIQIQLPPLRHRKEDIPLLVDHFLPKMQSPSGPVTIPGHVMDSLIAYDWPGNVRELRNVLQRYVTLGRLEFLSHCLAAPPELPAARGDTGLDLRRSAEALEKTLIAQALQQSGGNRTRAAAALGISRRALFRKMAAIQVP